MSSYWIILTKQWNDPKLGCITATIRPTWGFNPDIVRYRNKSRMIRYDCNKFRCQYDGPSAWWQTSVTIIASLSLHQSHVPFVLLRYLWRTINLLIVLNVCSSHSFRVPLNSTFRLVNGLGFVAKWRTTDKLRQFYFELNKY